MQLIINIIKFLGYEVETPSLFGIYHILCLIAVALLCVFLIVKFKNPDEKTVRKILFIASISTIALEIYKQFIFGVTIDGNTISYSYAWYAFPFQFCSTPMILQLIAAIVPSEKIRKILCAYLATYGLLAGTIVMVYPGDVFMYLAGINFQTMVCHGLMVAIGLFLLVRYIPLTYKTILHAISVFGIAVIIAMILNETMYHTGVIEGHTFNMFFISYHFDCTLPVLSSIYKVVPYPVFLAIYILAFSLVAAIILISAMGISKFITSRKLKKATN